MVVAEVHVAVGDMLNYDDKVIVLETGKVALDIPSPHQGIVAEVFVKVGDSLQSGQRCGWYPMARRSGRSHRS